MRTTWHGRAQSATTLLWPFHPADDLFSAAWYGARIILEQVSSESRPIFDFILELHRACSGNWDAIVGQVGVERDQLQQFLTYAATFLSNVGNHYGSGDQKFTFEIDQRCSPLTASVSRATLRRAAATLATRFQKRR